MELCNTVYYWSVLLHQASVPKPTSFDTAQMSDSLPPLKKCAWSLAVKMMEKINNVEENQWAGRKVRGPFLFLLEQPFIRYSSCWVIYCSVLLAMSLSYGLAGMWVKEMGCSSASSQELDSFSVVGSRKHLNPKRIEEPNILSI